MASDKVFASDITRTLNNLNNNLYELLTIDPVTPLAINNTKHLSCDFVPKADKYFIPKRKLRVKVKTVRDIRTSLEKDVYSTLSTDIEKQQNVLLRKITCGSSREEKTKLFAKDMLKSEKPISRTAWQMMININPDNYAHSSQFVLWNGKYIQVNGSRGGKSKFIYKYDLSERRGALLQRHDLKSRNSNTKKDLLKQSLYVKFRPGPLSKKGQLDVSYQKYNVGNIELAHLPKPGLDVLPEYGKPIETSVASFLHNLRDVDGVISDKWAEFAISALGTCDNGHAVQSNKDCCVTFNLSYKYDQRRLLMRYDVDTFENQRIYEQAINKMKVNPDSEDTTLQDVQKMLDEILISVEINLMQNTLYTGEDSPRELDKADVIKRFDSYPKQKVKRRGQSELHRLDVTVIRLFDNQEKKEMVSCPKSFCRLGCICDSIYSSIHLKNHCGRIECMFDCKCDFSKSPLRNYFEDDILPGLVSLDKEKSSKLSKEEQKFHQTVILSGEKSIVLKSKRRNWKAPEKYADFYSNMCLKTKKDVKRILTVIEMKLNCGNIEPWCMVHNLYKCFCKGKFTERLSDIMSNDDTKTIESNDTKLTTPESLNFRSSESNNKTMLRPRTHRSVNNEDKTDATSSLVDCNQGCARISAYTRRKYSNIFYSKTNKKIMELEQNDHGLRKRMMEILKIDEGHKKKSKKDSTKSSVIDLSSSPASSGTNEGIYEINDKNQKELPESSEPHKFTGDVGITQFPLPTNRQVNMKLKAWLEPSLKIYRERFANGFFKKSLEPPRHGKIALYPWDFIINRYHEKKNLFFVSSSKPVRIFMAIDSRNSMFEDCININSIKDLEEYPISVKNIITKEVDLLKNQLCILRGTNMCWELVGSITKVCDRKNSDSENNPSESTSDVEAQSPQNHTGSINSPATVVNDLEQNNTTDQSKWFIMTIENDFSEIQFYKKGFFVKYDSIIKAINVARVSDKTVRLSSQQRNEGNSDPQFGIYAIPNANAYCVFVGPYEKNEPLGIETVKTTLYNHKIKTRGVWITTNKVDNLEVIDNPLSFMSQVNLEHGQILDDTLQDETRISSVSCIENKSSIKAKEKNKVIKLVKPITIAKTNNFYHLTPSGILKPISLSPEKQIPKTPLILKKRLSLDFDAASNAPMLYRNLTSQSNETNKYLGFEENQKLSTKRPIAEITPQVKVVVDKEPNNPQQKTSNRKFEGGMFVLKPEEINSRSINSFTSSSTTVNNCNAVSAADNEIDMDIESFIAHSVECSAPTGDVYVISDDEDYCNIETSNKIYWKDVRIICRNVPNIGWISGRQDANKCLSFEFPGFKYTDFYPEEEAFDKITQVLSRKIYVPEHVDLAWSVVDAKDEFEKLNLNKLQLEHLNPDYVLTSKGLIQKFHLANRSNKKVKTYSKVTSARKSKTAPREIKGDDMELDAKSVINEPESESDSLLEKGELLLSETMLKKEELSNNFSKMSNDQRQKISDRLRTIISNSNSC